MWTARSAAFSSLFVLALALAARAEAPAPSGSGVTASASAGRAGTDDSLESALRAPLEQLVKSVADREGRVAVCVVELASAQVLAAHQEHLPLNPASTAKLLTAAATLAELGPERRFITELRGKIDGTRVERLELVGGADPALAGAQLVELAERLVEAGVRDVGRITVVNGRFETAHVPPAFEQQPDEWAPFRASVSALAVDRNALTVVVTPTVDGAPARVVVEPFGAATVHGTVQTSERGGSQRVRVVFGAGTKPRIDVSGSVPEGAAAVLRRRRHPDPTLVGGHVLRAALERRGVRVAGAVTASSSSDEPRLFELRSPPLLALLSELGKHSDNFTAEMLLRALSAEQRDQAASSTDGAARVEALLRSWSVLEAGMVVRNGSGLFDANRVTTAALAGLLRRAYTDPRIGPELAATLAIGGVDGTLTHRFRSLRTGRRLRAKTGTLAKTSALAGYLLGGARPVAFAVITDGVADAPAMRRAIDRFVLRVALLTE